MIKQLFLLILCLPAVFAHTGPAVSYSEVNVENDTLFFLKKEINQSYYIYITNPVGQEILVESLNISNEGSPCVLGDFLDSPLSNRSYYFVAECDKPINHLEISDAFFADHHIFSKVYTVHLGEKSWTFLGNTSMSFSLALDGKMPAQAASSLDVFSGYFKLGVEHILGGPDHLLFILGYLLLSITFIGLLKGITGFTVSHSFTLTLAALGILIVPSGIVEPLIALSIVVVGVLALFNWAKGWLIRFGIIFGFGLFHGLGFAGSIADVGFPKENFVSALLGFNIGIEAGQLAAVLLVFPLLMFLDKNHKKFSKKLRWLLALMVILGGTYWLLGRIFFA